MASSVIKRITDTAEKLHAIRQTIAQKEEENKKELEAMKVERDAIQAALLADLNKNGLASIKVSSGDSFIRQTRKSLEITSEPHALEWAIQNRAVSVNKILVAQKIKDLEKLPAGFQEVETEFISVRKAKEKE